MNKQLTNQRFQSAFGITVEDLARAFETIHKIKTSYGLLCQDGTAKSFFSLPASVFIKAIAGFSAPARGLLLEQFYARNIGPVRFTRTNENHKGDLTDGKGRKHEIKTSRIGANGMAQFTGVRPHDEVDAFHFVVIHDDHMVSHELARKDLHKIPLYNARNTTAKTVAFQVGGSVHAELAGYSSTQVLDDTTTGQRWDSLRSLAEADVQMDDLDHLVQSIATVREKVAGIGTSAHCSLDELLSVRPLVEGSKFGLMVQDWLADHLEVAVARTPGKGDGVGRKGRKIEVKYSSRNTEDKYRLSGIKPSEFDDLYLALRTEDEIEFFHLTKRSAQGFVRRFGKETAPGIFSVTTAGDNGRAARFLRASKAVDLNVRSH